MKKGPWMTKGWLFALMLILLVPMLSGCWDRLELEDRATILGLAIDPVGDGNVGNVTGPYARSEVPGYQITAQVAIPGRIPLGPGEGSDSGGSENPVWVLTATGQTFDDAMSTLQKDLADKLFLGHLRAIIVNQKLVQNKGMKDVQDYLRRNPEIRRLAWMVISKTEAKEAMAAAPKLERVPTLYLVGTMDHAVQLGKIPNEFLGQFWSVESSTGQEPVLPLISVISNERVGLDGLALFKGYKMVGSLDPVETAAFMELTDEQKGGYSIAVPLKGVDLGSVSLRATTRRTRLKLKRINGHPSFNTYSRIEVNVEENTSQIPLQDQVPTLEQKLTDLLYRNQEELIRKFKKLQIDPIGFGEYVRGGYSEYWRRNVHSREDWDKIFVKMPVHCSVKTYIRRAGVKAT